jgi:hypothetical protein
MALGMYPEHSAFSLNVTGETHSLPAGGGAPEEDLNVPPDTVEYRPQREDHEAETGNPKHTGKALFVRHPLPPHRLARRGGKQNGGEGAIVGKVLVAEFVRPVIGWDLNRYPFALAVCGIKGTNKARRNCLRLPCSTEGGGGGVIKKEK